MASYTLLASPDCYASVIILLAPPPAGPVEWKRRRDAPFHVMLTGDPAMAEHATPLPIETLPAPAVDPGVRVIDDVDELDKDNLGWTKGYVAGLTERLAREQAADQPDFVMIAYLKNEVATYQELLDRTAKR